jgi:hypothetical protein
LNFGTIGKPVAVEVERLEADVTTDAEVLNWNCEILSRLSAGCSATRALVRDIVERSREHLLVIVFTVECITKGGVVCGCFQGREILRWSGIQSLVIHACMLEAEQTYRGIGKHQEYPEIVIHDCPSVITLTSPSSPQYISYTPL